MILLNQSRLNCVISFDNRTARALEIHRVWQFHFEFDRADKQLGGPASINWKVTFGESTYKSELVPAGVVGRSATLSLLWRARIFPSTSLAR